MTDHMRGHDILLAIADWHRDRGLMPPRLSTPPAVANAERLARVINTGTEEPAALPARVADSPTQIMPRYTPAAVAVPERRSR